MGTVIVVEDEVLARECVVELLEEAGADVVPFGTADEALRFLDAHDGNDAAVLFTDIRMPGRLNGIDLAREVSTRWPWIKVLVTSSHQPSGDGSTLPRNAKFISKPWILVDMVEMLRAAAQGLRH